MHDQLGSFRSRTLAGRPLALPRDLRRPTLLLFAYRQHQQRDVDTWIRAVADDERIDVLEVPVLGRRWRPARALIDGGMASNMDQPTREQTMCVYTDVDRFRRRVLGTDSERVTAVLVSADGRIAWHALGPATAVSLAELVVAIGSLVEHEEQPDASADASWP